MMNMINSHVRFALQPSDGRIYDYLTGRWMDPVGVLNSSDGDWDLPTVKRCLERGCSVTHALVAKPKNLDEVDAEQTAKAKKRAEDSAKLKEEAKLQEAKKIKEGDR